MYLSSMYFSWMALLGVVFWIPTAAQAQSPTGASIRSGKSTAKGDARGAKPVEGASFDAAGIEFFETKIRPVLVQQCYGCHSHSAGKSFGNLFLDSRKAILAGGQQGADLMPGQPDKSRLIDAVRYAKPDLQMPPKAKLSDAVLADMTEWVRMGAPWPEERPNSNPTAAVMTPLEKAKRQHWAWQPVRKPRVPAVKRKTWPKNPIDNFILAKLEAKGLTPSPYADRRTLIRRAYFDLIGLPPTPEEVAAFQADRSPDAWSRVVDHLLASPHYGERWGRYWLDVARYGEDQAHTFDARLYPQGFRYRDWVAHAFNSDMPYDRFLKEQIAADLLNEPDRQEQLPALGFFALGPVYYGDGKMFDQYDDRIDTLSRGILGLTVACARCHDHKYDPITQKDYYALAGVFASTSYIEVPLAPPEPGQGVALEGAAKNAGGATERAGSAIGLVNRNDKIKAKSDELDKFTGEQTTRLRSELIPQTARYLVAVWRLRNRQKTDPKLTMETFAAAEGVFPAVLERWANYLNAKPEIARPQLTAWNQLLQREDPKTDLSHSETDLTEVRKVAEGFQSYLQSLIQRRDAKSAAKIEVKAGQEPLDKTESAALDEIVGQDGVLTVPPAKLDTLLTGDNRSRFAILTAELNRLKMGDYIHALTENARIANVPVLLRGNPDTPGAEEPRHFLSILAGETPAPFTQGSGRLELANAVADKNNPLTARVMVNRIWQHHFGVGIVRTTSNFGMLGELPTHPELLDYLTSRFVDGGWSLKALHRQIMLSATYQMRSANDPHNFAIDPDNRLVWHMPRRRLEVEPWRDAMLSVAAKLDPTIGGPSVSLTAPENCRRTFYAAVSRHDLDSMLRLFDFPDPNATIDARMTTTVPLQQLFVLNSEFMVQQAKAFAARLTSVPGETDPDRIRRAFLLAFSRPPTSKELNLGLAFLQGPRAASAAARTATTPDAAAKPSTLSRWEQYAQVLLSANEFMYID